MSIISCCRVTDQPLPRRVSAVTDPSNISRSKTHCLEPEIAIEPITCSLRGISAETLSRPEPDQLDLGRKIASYLLSALFERG